MKKKADIVEREVHFSKIRKTKGITLVALIVTIIILLILAGISIASLTGNGIFEKAKLAKEENIKIEMLESLTLALDELQLEKRGYATIDDINQDWITSKLTKYKNTITENIENNFKQITMEKDGVIVSYEIDEKLKITDTSINNENQIRIQSAEGLLQFARNINEGIDNYEGKTVILQNNIDLSTVCSEEKGSWVGIGYYNSEEDYKSFKGHFNGNGYIISNLYIDEPTEQYCSLFGALEDGTIENVILNSGEINCKGGAPLVGVNKNGIIINCQNKAVTVYSRKESSSAGIVQDNYGDVIKCINYADIIEVGDAHSHVGVGLAGICGWNYGNIIQCVNYGNIDVNGHSYSYTQGGIVAGISSGVVKYCYNYGEIKGYYFVGGICGNQYGGEICYNYNCGNVTGTANIGAIRGITENNSNNIHDNYYLTGLASDSTSTAKNLSQMNAQEFIVLLTKEDETETIWKLNPKPEGTILLNWQ